MATLLLEKSRVTSSMKGIVVAANDIAARAGTHVLRSGGNAADAAAATAAALCVVDPANCGIGGYGGFAVVQRQQAPPAQIAFNAAVPGYVRDGKPTHGGPGSHVTPPAVVAGVCALAGKFGRLGVRAVFAPAIDLAAEGFAIGPGLADALGWACARHRGLNDAFRHTYLRNGVPLREGQILMQPALAQTLDSIAAQGAALLRASPLVDGLVRTANAAGGALTAADFQSLHASVADAVVATYGDCEVCVSDPDQCGAAILLSALRSLEGIDLGANRRERYVDAVGNALVDAWRHRDANFSPLSRKPSETTHVCTADADGMLVSMTFTHGPIWFGSGLLDDESGVLLNCGRHILARRNADGEVVAQPHLTPAIVRRGGTRYALGSPGGRRIPAIVLQAIIDLVHYGVPIDDVLAAPRLSANADGTFEAEAALADAMPARRMRTIEPHEYFGPAGAIAWDGRRARGAADPRFDDGCALGA
jgi:gamma-glutamyltranspeptidase/glutathione hydrolase